MWMPLALAVVLQTPSAVADDRLCEVTRPAHIAEMLEGIETAVARVRMDEASRQIDLLHARLPCLETAATPSQLTRYGRAKALLAFMNQEEEEARTWMWMAQFTTPDWPWPEGMDEDHPLRALLANRLEPSLDGPPGKGLNAPKKGAILWNGSPLGVPAVPEDVPGLTQIADAKGVVTDAYWQEGGRFREDLIGVAGAPLSVPSWFTPEDTAAAIQEMSHSPLESTDATVAKAADCQPLSADAFRALVDKAHAAIDSDDLLGHTRHYATLRKNLPCMGAPVPSDAWATFLVGLAIVERATGHDWKQPLDTALSVFPEVARDKAPKAIRDYVVQPAPPGDAALPEGAQFFLDGQPLTRVPDLAGLHLLQREVDGQWSNLITRDTTFPEDWLQTAKGKKSRSAGASERAMTIAVAGIGGFGSLGQSLDNPGHIPNLNAAGAVAGLTHWGSVPAGTVGLGWDLTLPLQVGSTLGADVFAGIELGGQWRAFLGGGATSVAFTRGDTTSIVVLPTPHLGGAGSLSLGDLELDLALGGGWTPSATHLRGRTALLGSGDASWLVGLEGTWTAAGFVDALDRTIHTSRWHAGLAAGIVLR